MSALDVSVGNESRHAVFVQRFSGGLSNEFLPFLEDLKNEINTLLLQTGTPTSQARLNRLLEDVRRAQEAVYSSYQGDLFDQLEDFAVSESDWERRSLDDAFANIETDLPAVDQVVAAVRNNPLLFPDSNDVILLEPFVNNWSNSEMNRVTKIIRTGYTLGQTTDQIARRITGKGGTLDKQTLRSNKAMVRTSVVHTSSMAREQTMMENDDVVTGYEWISTLDDRTTAQCRSLDGKVFKWSDDFKPKPPYHVACRSVTVPVVDKRYAIDDSNSTRGSKGAEGGKQVSAKETYYSFLKKQPKAFQDEVLGSTRGKLLRNGGLNADEFAKLSVDQKFRPLTLDEMKAKNPMAFEKAGI